MIAIIRRIDNRVCRDIQGSDFPQDKKDKLVFLQEELENIPETEPATRQKFQSAITQIQADWDMWLLNRCERYARKGGGVASDYFTVPVLPEDELAFFAARFITYDGENLLYDVRQPYIIDGSEITCTSGWVIGDERLIADDVTDFSSLTLTEPLYFQLWYAQNEGTQEISVQLLTRNEDEEFSPLPANLTKRGRNPVCEGRIETDNQITIGRF